MRALLLTGLALALALPAAAKAEWFTITGVPGDPKSDYIQVDPSSIKAENQVREIRLRVSRSHPRANKDGITFRSYEADALVDCARKSARYTWARFYAEPNFQGMPVAEREYEDDTVRTVGFWGFNADYASRVIKAACVVRDR